MFAKICSTMETGYLYTKTKGRKYNRRFLAINTCGYHTRDKYKQNKPFL